MNAVVSENKTDYFVDGLSNDEYHADKSTLSSSVLKAFADDPASVIWQQNAEQDKTKLDAIDFGTDFHTYFLEPSEFKKHYKVLPEFNRRKPDERQAELDMIDQWKDEGITPVKSEDMEKLEAMRKSALAHPTVGAIMSMGGVAERSYYWQDYKTGVKCKCRPDLIVEGINDKNRPAFMPKHCTTLVMDLKTIARMDRVQAQIEELKYFVQDAFYTRGIAQVTDTKVCFVFAFVSTSLSLGRYPVKVVMLEATARFDGMNIVTDTLSDYAATTNWESVVLMDRPAWAQDNDEVL